jgi:signal transduction histidine kinase/FixJ family two-component response regulator
MHVPQLRTALPWLIGLSLFASLSCFAVAIYLGFAAGADATQDAARQLSGQADALARQIDSDVAVYDLTLREAARLLPPGVPGAAPPSLPLLDLPLTAGYIGFINVLNEFGDVVADPRSNVSRPVNFAGRDYFQDQQKNPADIVMIGRPFATAPNQHASLPISRRLNRPDGSFAGVVVAGVRLTWLSDLLSRPSPGPHPEVTIRRGDGLILMRTPYDPDAIARTDAADPAWQAYLRTGLTGPMDDRTGIHLFHRINAGNLVLELGLNNAEIAAGEKPWLLWLPLLALIPGLCVLGLSLPAHRMQRRGDRIEAAANTAYDESQRMLANMSHELRTPLTGILGQAELMAREGGLSERQANRLKALMGAGTLMRNIVNRVIDVARPDDVVGPPILTACDLDLLLGSALDGVEGEARRKGLLLTSNVDLAMPRRAMLEPDRVRQMLNNLLMNAVKFTDRGSVALRVMSNSDQLRFEVADTGPGIPANKSNRLFRAYDRLDIPASRVAGSGLGLSITERFARGMGGRVGHSENPGGGSVFWFELPFIEPVADTAVIAPPAPVPPDVRHLRVLLADDNDLTRAVTRDFLLSGGHAVTEVPGGEAAVNLVRQQDFDVVLTDMRMPIVDGMEVTRRIRALPNHRARTPIVLVTADIAAVRDGESGQTGVDLCVQKPFTRTELLAAVTAAARLAPVPDAPDSDSPALNMAALAELKQTVGNVAFAAHLNGATGRIADLVTLLESPDALDNPNLGEAAHDLIGVAGLMGFTVLGAALQRFDSATDRAIPAAALLEAAKASLQALRCQLASAAAGS